MKQHLKRLRQLAKRLDRLEANMETNTARIEAHIAGTAKNRRKAPAKPKKSSG